MLFQKETSYPKCFVSYCWANSHEAVKKGTKSSEGSLGWGDPRDLKKHLEKNKIPCWMDIERIGQVLYDKPICTSFIFDIFSQAYLG